MEDKVAIVMGGSTGIGAKTAQLLARRGAKVCVAGLGQSDLEKTVGEIEAAGGVALPVLMDVSEEDAIASCVKQAVSAFGKVNAVHGNVAVTNGADLARDVMLADTDFATWDKTMTVNVRGLALLAKHCLPHMIKAGGGAFVFSGSGRASQGHLEYTAYGVSKSAVEGLSRYLATQYGKRGIRSNVVEIGLVMTDAVRKNLTPELCQLFLEHHLTRELGQPQDIANVVAFLLSDEARFVTGATLAVDGGLGCHTPIFADQLRMTNDSMNASL